MSPAPSLVGCGKPRNPTDPVSSSVNGDDKPFSKDGPVWPSPRSLCVNPTQRLGAHREPQMTPGWAEAALPGLIAFQTQGSPGSPLSPALTASADRSPRRDKTLPRSAALAEAPARQAASARCSQRPPGQPAGASGDALQGCAPGCGYITLLCLQPGARTQRKASPLLRKETEPVFSPVRRLLNRTSSPLPGIDL